ncbi:MAG TPA: exonuclease subunit SbcD [Abditibacterium sp.]|jgi:exonuclease SbcD
MRILHTADWHMNTSLGRQDLSPYIVAALETIADYLEKHRVEVMVVAGDLFSERSRDEGMREAIAQIHRIFGPFVARGGTILAVAGNHDSELRFETLRDALRLGAGDDFGRFVLSANPQTLVLRDQRGDAFGFALLPYPTPRAYLGGVEFSSLEEKNRLVQAAFAAKLDEIAAQLPPQLPAILVSHVHIRGAESHSLYQVSESDDVVFEPSQITHRWCYAAYGHIHKPGAVGAPHVRYSGSVAPLDAAERFDHKSVVLLDVSPQGQIETQILPLPRVPMHQITLDCAQNEPQVELQRWRDEIPDCSLALVHTTLRYTPKTHSISALRREIEAAFPRWYGRVEEKIGVELAPRPLELPGEAAVNPLSSDVPTLVRNYLQQRLEPNADRDAILAIAEELLSRS